MLTKYKSSRGNSKQLRKLVLKMQEKDALETIQRQLQETEQQLQLDHQTTRDRTRTAQAFCQTNPTFNEAVNDPLLLKLQDTVQKLLGCDVGTPRGVDAAKPLLTDLLQEPNFLLDLDDETWARTNVPVWMLYLQLRSRLDAFTGTVALVVDGRPWVFVVECAQHDSFYFSRPDKCTFRAALVGTTLSLVALNGASALELHRVWSRFAEVGGWVTVFEEENNAQLIAEDVQHQQKYPKDNDFARVLGWRRASGLTANYYRALAGDVSQYESPAMLCFFRR